MLPKFSFSRDLNYTGIMAAFAIKLGIYQLVLDVLKISNFQFFRKDFLKVNTTVLIFKGENQFT